ncbi:Hypothetical predicted protein, partial [Lynx pardinus]
CPWKEGACCPQSSSPLLQSLHLSSGSPMSLTLSLTFSLVSFSEPLLGPSPHPSSPPPISLLPWAIACKETSGLLPSP